MIFGQTLRRKKQCAVDASPTVELYAGQPLDYGMRTKSTKFESASLGSIEAYFLWICLLPILAEQSISLLVSLTMLPQIFQYLLVIFRTIGRDTLALFVGVSPVMCSLCMAFSDSALFWVPLFPGSYCSHIRQPTFFRHPIAAHPFARACILFVPLFLVTRTSYHEMPSPDARSVDLPIAVLGGRVSQFDSQALPQGASPFCQDVIFSGANAGGAVSVGGVGSRPGMKSLYPPFFGNPAVNYLRTFVIPLAILTNSF